MNFKVLMKVSPDNKEGFVRQIGESRDLILSEVWNGAQLLAGVEQEIGKNNECLLALVQKVLRYESEK